MPSMSQTKEMAVFEDTVKKRGPYLVFRKGVVFAFPGRETREYEPGDYVKLENSWLKDRAVALRLIGILSDSKAGRDDAVAVLASADEYESVAQRWLDARNAAYAMHAEDVRRSRQRALGKADQGLVRENADLKQQLADLTERVSAMEGGSKRVRANK